MSKLKIPTIDTHPQTHTHIDRDIDTVKISNEFKYKYIAIG